MCRFLSAAVVAAAFTGCSGWDNLPTQDDQFLDEALWNPRGAIPTEDGLYVMLPHAGGVAMISPKGGGSANLVDIGEGRISRLTAAPDGRTLVAFIDRFGCNPEHEDPEDFEIVDDCGEDDLVATTELAVIENAKVTASIEINSTYNAIAYADDGRYAIAYLDFSLPGVEYSGVVSLTSIIVVDLEELTAAPVSVGFAADQVLFTHNSDGQATRAVVLSQNSVAVVDLAGETGEAETTFPLTLDPDQTVVPVGVELTPDGRYALISVDGSADLYALDLESRSINIVELSARPAAMSVNEATDRTVLVFGNGSVVDVLEHEFFDIESFALDEPMTDIAEIDDFALLYNTDSGHDVYRLELETNELVEYRLQNPAISMHVAPTQDFAIALTRPEDGFGGGVEGSYDQSPGMEVIDLTDDDTSPFLLEGTGLGVAWSFDDASLTALILQEDVRYVYQLDLYTGLAEELDLTQSPIAIGSMPDGTFFITHDSALGLVSFLDPDTGKIDEVAGFAALGLADTIELIQAELKGDE